MHITAMLRKDATRFDFCDVVLTLDGYGIYVRRFMSETGFLVKLHDTLDGLVDLQDRFQGKLIELIANNCAMNMGEHEAASVMSSFNYVISGGRVKLCLMKIKGGWKFNHEIQDFLDVEGVKFSPREKKAISLAGREYNDQITTVWVRLTEACLSEEGVNEDVDLLIRKSDDDRQALATQILSWT